MSQLVTLIQTLKTPGASYPFGSDQVITDNYDPEEIEVPANGTVEIDVVAPLARTKAWAMHLSKSPNATAASNLNAKILLNANSTASPTILLTATNGAGWSQGSPFVNPIQVDITKIFVVNAENQPVIYRHAFCKNESPQSP